MNVIITGATKGIGLATAKAFINEGAKIITCGRSKTDAITENEFTFFQADLSNKHDCIAFAAFALAQGKPDVLVNNAGSYVPGSVLSDEMDALEKMLLINLMSAWYVSNIIGNAMKKNRSGHIFNISSIAGLQAYEGGGAYSISKYAMNGLNDNLRHELKSFGVKVTNVLPGAVLTSSWGDFDNSSGRIMEAEDIAKMIVAASKLSPQATVEQIVVRPQLGDL